MHLLRRLAHRRRGDRFDAGQGLAEFAIVLPIFLLVVFGMIDVGRVVWATDDITNAAREGARYASIHGGSFLTSCPVGPGLSGTPATGCPAWSPDSKQPIRDATKAYFIASGGSSTVWVCYYTTTSCSGDTDQSGVTNVRGTYVTVTVQSTVPILTGRLLGLSGFTVNAHSTVLINN
ncbi:MAG TPA: TadE family protein [Candidatus Limnocylindrales bacterium]|nr:TadE family protein [Candidatus Limnocylindrales bacterium]